MRSLWMVLSFLMPLPHLSAKEEQGSMNWNHSRMKAHLVRLRPGQDLVAELTRWAKTNRIEAACILSAAGSLKKATLRFANQPKPKVLEGHFEIVSLSGMLDAASMHVHASISLPNGETIGGHLMGENIVYTTVELAVGEFEELSFSREKDPTYGYPELNIRKKN